jgi:flagellar basal body-associated protein FliL
MQNIIIIIIIIIIILIIIIIIIIMCYVEEKYSTSDPDSNIIYGSNTKVNITKSKET